MKNKFPKSAFGLAALLVVSLLASSQITAARRRGVSTEAPSRSNNPLVSTWSRTYGGSLSDGFNSLAPTSDGGYIAVGPTSSFGAGKKDVWVVKLDASGNMTWQKTYGGSNHESGRSVNPTNDGGYMVAARTNSFGAGNYDIWLLKLDSSGNLTWQQTYGGTGDEAYPRIVQTNDGGYIVGADTASFGAGATDIWVLKLNSAGTITWQKTYGGIGDDFVDFIMPTSDGGYIFSADTTSFAPNNKAWLVKLDSSGNVTWQKIYGGSNVDSPNPVFPTSDGGYIVAGSTQSLGAGSNDAWVLKVDANGNLAGICPPPSSTSATVTNSSATVGTTTITPGTTLVTPSTTSVTPANTSVTPGNTSQCFLNLPLILR